jgi:hypothetical protein
MGRHLFEDPPMTYSQPLDTRYDKHASVVLGRDHWRVLTPFSYKIADGEWVTIPAGYLTDGASVPKVFWNIIPPWGAYGQAAVVHDILCEYLTIVKDGAPVRIDRSRCDEILNEAMYALGVPDGKRMMIYTAVCAYRWFTGTAEPSNTLVKRALEAQWVQGL